MFRLVWYGRFIVAWCVGLVFATAPNTARADAELALSLPDALARAAARAPDVLIAEHTVREARARRVGAGVVLPVNPRVAGDARPPITGGTLHDLGYAANLEVLFDVGGAPRARVREAERGADLARTDLGATQREAQFAAWAAYVRTRIAEERVAEMRTLVKNAERILGASRQRAEAGASGDIEQTLAASDLAQLRATIEDAQRRREERIADLRAVLDLEPAQPVTLTTELRDPPAAADEISLVKRALVTRPELAQLRAHLELLDATEERLKREIFPRIGFYVGVDAAPVSPIFGVLGLSVELPIAQRNQGPRAVVRASKATDMARVDLTRRRIEREVRTALTSYALRVREYLLLDDTALPAAERTLELVEVGWLAGRFDVFRVATAARDVARVRGLRLDALEAAWLERIAVSRAVGVVTP